MTSTIHFGHYLGRGRRHSNKHGTMRIWSMHNIHISTSLFVNCYQACITLPSSPERSTCLQPYGFAREIDPRQMALSIAAQVRLSLHCPPQLGDMRVALLTPVVSAVGLFPLLRKEHQVARTGVTYAQAFRSGSHRGIYPLRCAALSRYDTLPKTCNHLESHN